MLTLTVWGPKCAGMRGAGGWNSRVGIWVKRKHCIKNIFPMRDFRHLIFVMWFPKPFKMFKVSQFTKWIRSFRTSLNFVWKTMFFSLKKLWKVSSANIKKKSEFSEILHNTIFNEDTIAEPILHELAKKATFYPLFFNICQKMILGCCFLEGTQRKTHY